MKIKCADLLSFSTMCTFSQAIFLLLLSFIVLFWQFPYKHQSNPFRTYWLGEQSPLLHSIVVGKLLEILNRLLWTSCFSRHWKHELKQNINSLDYGQQALSRWMGDPYHHEDISPWGNLWIPLTPHYHSLPNDKILFLI